MILKNLDDELVLLGQRVVLMSGTFDAEYGEKTIAKILFLIDKDSSKPIDIVINSEGGDVGSALAICDFINSLSCPVRTIALDSCGGSALLILAAGTPGSRHCTEKTGAMLVPIRWPSAIERAAKEEVIADVTNSILVMLEENTNLSHERLKTLQSNQTPMTANDLLSWGFVDEIISTNSIK